MNDDMRILVRVMRDATVKVLHGYVENGCAEGRMWRRGLCTFIELEVHRHFVSTAKHKYELRGDRWVSLMRLQARWMREWEGSTKRDAYPVPPPHDFEQSEYDRLKGKTPGNSYFTAITRREISDNMYEGEYGESRLELARFIYNKCEEFLDGAAKRL